MPRNTFCHPMRRREQRAEKDGRRLADVAQPIDAERRALPFRRRTSGETNPTPTANEEPASPRKKPPTSSAR